MLSMLQSWVWETSEVTSELFFQVGKYLFKTWNLLTLGATYLYILIWKEKDKRNYGWALIIIVIIILVYFLNSEMERNWMFCWCFYR